MNNIEIIRKAASIVGNQPICNALTVERWLLDLADEMEQESNPSDQRADQETSHGK